MPLPATILLHAANAASAVVDVIQLWSREYPGIIAHTHADLPASHPHLRGRLGQNGHSHVFVVHALHRHRLADTVCPIDHR